MNGQFDEELLSAFHDGELPDPERQSVEDRIAEAGSEARELLDDYAELSNSLRSLPTSQAPPDFRDVVMRQVQGLSDVRSKPTAAQRSRRPLLFWTGGTAASLLIAVGLFQLVNSRHDFSAMSDVELAENSDATTAPAMEMAYAQEVADSAAVGLTAPAESPEPVSIASEADSMLDDAPLSIAANDNRLLNLLRSLAEAPDVGEHVDVVQEVGGELVLIKFQVVDVIKAYGEFQILLDQIGIERVNSEGDEFSDDDLLAENRLRGIFLEASNDEMLAALEGMSSTGSVVLADTSGVDMASALGVDRNEIPEFIQFPDGFGGGGGSNQAIAQAEAAESPGAPETPSRSGALPIEADRPAADEVEAGDESAQRDLVTGAYRMELSLPDQIVSAIEEQQRQQEVPQTSGEPGDADSSRDRQNSRSDSRPGESASMTRTRFLLIFVAETDAGDN